MWEGKGEGGRARGKRGGEWGEKGQERLSEDSKGADIYI